MSKLFNLVNRFNEKLSVLWKTGAIHIMLGSFINKFVSMFGSIVIVRLLSKQEYGVLSYIENLYSYAYVIAGLGLSNALLRYVILAKSPEKKYKYFNFCTKNGFFFNLLLVTLVMIINTFYNHPAEFTNARLLLWILILELPLQHIIDDILLMERGNFSNFRFTYFSLFSSVAIILTRIVSALLFGIYGVILTQVIVYFLICLFFLKLTTKKYKQDIKEIQFSKSEKVNIFLYSIQYMITNGLWTIFMLNDTYLLGKLTESAAVLADYRVAYVIPAAISIFSNAIGTYISPYFVKNENNLKWVKKYFLLTFLFTAIFIGILTLGVGILGKPLISIIYGDNYLNIVPLMRLLLLSAFINCGLRYTSANLLASMGQIKYNMIISILGMVLQISLDLILIPEFDAYGAAITSIISYLFMAVVLFIIFCIKYRVFNKNL